MRSGLKRSEKKSSDFFRPSSPPFPSPASSLLRCDRETRVRVSVGKGFFLHFRGAGGARDAGKVEKEAGEVDEAVESDCSSPSIRKELPLFSSLLLFSFFLLLASSIFMSLVDRGALGVSLTNFSRGDRVGERRLKKERKKTLSTPTSFARLL